MNTVKAKQVQICIFTLAPTSRDNASPEAGAAYDAFAQVIWALRQRHGASVPVYMEFCPLTIDTNAVIVTQQGIDLSLLPAAQVWAEFEDGTSSQYFLKKDFGDRFTGLNWKPDDVRPYVEALLYRKPESVAQPIICKLLPPLCEVGVWLWLGATLFAAYQTSQARNVGRVAWGAATVLAGEAFVKRGGIEHLKSLVSKSTT